jgi:cytochrome P450
MTNGWAAQHVIVEQQHYFAAEIEARRVEPRDDFLTDLLNATLDASDDTPGGPLNMGEMLSIIRQIQVAGSETTASLLADLMVVFAQQPEQFEAVRRDPARIVAVVEEALRFTSPNQGLFRILTADTVVAGQPVPAGATLGVMFGSANRDERTFADPDAFDPERDGLGRHIAFGKGIHVCLGAALARLEARFAVEILAERFSRVEMAPDAKLRYAPSAILRGLERLDLVLTCA